MRQFPSARVRLLVGLTAATACQIAFGQEHKPAAAPDAGPVPQLIQKLDSSDVQIRTEATEQLLTDSSISLKQIEAALRSETLSPEQRQRLSAVAFRRFRSGPHAAMGIRNDQVSGVHGVVIAYLQPGFPAGEVLRLGDRITVADGIIIDTWERLRSVIISHDPGDAIGITVVREGATLNLTIKLAEYARLNQPSQVEPLILEGAWDIRSRGFRPPNLAPPAPIESGISIVDWQRTGASADEPPPADFAAADGSRTSVVAGGEPRGGQPGRQAGAVLTRNFNSRFAPGQGRLNGPQVAPGLDGDMARARLLQLQQTRESRAAQFNANNERLRDSTTPGSVRETLRAANATLSDSIRVLDIQIQSIQAELNRRPRR